MPKATNIFYHLRHLLMSITLLWALMLNGQEVVAYTSEAGNTQEASSTLASSQTEPKAIVKQKVSLEGTTSFIALDLQQDIEPLPQQPAFAHSLTLLLPAYTTIPPGGGFISTLFPITIQPNAP